MHSKFNTSLNPAGKPAKSTPITIARSFKPRFSQHGNKIEGMPTRKWEQLENGLWYSRER